MVSNLVENAIRCTPAPGTVTITTSPGTITVADTGRGLTSDDLPRAFERFYLYSRYGTDRPVGTGLGLAIVKELTEAMGGTVQVSSAVGVGTAFTVVLPQDPDALPEATTAVTRWPPTAVTMAGPPVRAPPAARRRDRRRHAAAPPPPAPPASTADGRDHDRGTAPAAPPRTMSREVGGRRIYRSRAVRRRRSALVVVVAATLALVVIVAAQGASPKSVRVTFDRRAAAAYADAWALKVNPEYWSSEDSDCANFVSQCLAAGGLRPTYDAGREWRSNGLEFPTDRLGQLRRAEAGAHLTRRDAHALRRAGHAHAAAPTGRPATSCTWATWRTASWSGST